MIRSISCCQDFRNIEKTIQIDNGNVCASIGKSSYLVGASLETGHDNGHIFVGNYSSLAHGLIFVIGLDHAFRITTYPLEQIGLSASEAYQVLSKKDTLRLGRDQIIIGNDVWIGRGATIMGGGSYWQWCCNWR